MASPGPNASPRDANDNALPREQTARPGTLAHPVADGQEPTSANRPALAVALGEQCFELDPGQLTDADVRSELLARCQAEDGPVVFTVGDLPGWEDAARWQLLQLAARLGDRARFRLPGQQEASDPFRAVLDAMVGPQPDAARCIRGRRAALEAALLFHPAGADLVCSAIVRRLRALGVQGVRTDDVRDQLAELAGALAGQTPREQLPRVRDVWPEAPVPPEAVVPPRSSLAPDGVTQAMGKATVHLAGVVVISARLVDVAEGTEALELAWPRDGGWRQHVVGRAEALDARKVIELAAHGLPVNSNTAPGLVQYLADFEAANLACLPRRKVARQMGWQGPDGRDGFLWGRTHITEHGLPGDDPGDVDADHAGAAGGADGSITFRGADAGDEQLADGFHAHGSFDGWRQAVAPLAPYPRVRLALYVGLVPPVLSLTRSPNFALDYSGETSNGKTTTQRVAASAWGRPDERSPAAALSTWDSTRVYRERAAVTLNNLPLILDDTKRVQNPRDVAQTLYDVASGRGRGRGSLKGTQRAGTWVTVLITSGETPATSFTEDGGTRPRVLTLWGSPFVTRDAATAATIRQVSQGIAEHYGHAGPAFVAYLLRQRADWPAWRQEYEGLVQEYAARAADNPVGSRVAAHFAAVRLTARLAHAALALPWPEGDPLESLLDELLQEASEADRASQALALVVGWAQAHQDEFYGRRRRGSGDGPDQPLGGWAGRWDLNEGKGGEASWERIGFFPTRLRAILQEAGYDAEAVLRTWQDRGWLVTDGEGRPRYKTRIGKENAWVIAIGRAAVEGLDGSTSAGETPEPELPDNEAKLVVLQFWRGRGLLAD